jgi:hypothetical protein
MTGFTDLQVVDQMLREGEVLMAVWDGERVIWLPAT